ncbi:MAG: phosphatase PAP2 family protein [Opitutus sp.]|nr:phosphatase PAP2 family protein [Opitutus sp.]
MKSASEKVPALNQSGTPVPTRRFRCPPAEWIVGLAFVAFGLWAYLQTPVSWVKAGVILHRHLAQAFTASSHLMMTLAYSVTLLRYVPEAERRTWTRNAAFLASAIALACVLLVPTPQATQLGRLLESSMLGMVLTALTLTLFLPVAGLVSLRRVVGTIAETLLLWGPYLIYFAFCGFALAALPVRTLEVKDPTLMRMDLSLGFSASQIAYSWRYDAPWVYDFSSVAYRLLGLLVALVIARLHIARAWAHARRALFVSFLVGVTGLTCYRIVPAIGPIFAYTPSPS